MNGEVLSLIFGSGFLGAFLLKAVDLLVEWRRGAPKKKRDLQKETKELLERSRQELFDMTLGFDSALDELRKMGTSHDKLIELNAIARGRHQDT